MTFKSIFKRRFSGPETGLSFNHCGSENPFFFWLKDGKKRLVRTAGPKLKRNDKLRAPEKQYVIC